MKNWQAVKIQNGLATFAAEDLRLMISVRDTKNNMGCFDLTLCNSGHLVGTAFWHGADMDIPENCYEDGEFNWEKYFGDPEFPKCLNYVDWKKINVLEMTDEAQEDLIIGKPYSAELCDQFDWAGAYPVVSGSNIIAIYDAAWPEESGYGNKPIINDEYVDADAEDLTEG